MLLAPWEEGEGKVIVLLSFVPKVRFEMKWDEKHQFGLSFLVACIFVFDKI